MRPLVWVLLCGALLAPPVLAAKPVERAGEPDARPQGLGGELDTFLEEAIREGLLAPAGTGVPRAEPRRQPAEPAPAPSDLWAKPVTLDCTQGYPLDFSDYRAISQYQDIVAYRQSAQQSAPQADEDAAPVSTTLARAYLSLDLSSEAVMSLGAPGEGEKAAIYRLATLLEGRDRPDVEYFQALSDCYPQAGFWLAMAEMTAGEPGGAARLDRHLNDYRALPLQLRSRVAALAIPALDKQGQSLLAHKMIAGFSVEEIAASSQLRFSQAILELSNGNAAAEATIRGFLMQSRFQEEALSSLLRNGRQVDSRMRAMLVDGMLLKLEQVQRDADVRASLGFVLSELAAGSRYMTLIDMAGRPNMQGAAAQDEIRKHFAAALERDIAGEDALRRLAAIEALSIEEGLLENYPGRTQLYEAATLQAVKLGFGAMATSLSAKAAVPEGTLEGRSALARRIKDYASVYSFAEAEPENARLGLIAALSAIEAGDEAQLRQLETRLQTDETALLALIEQDAASRRWMVSEALYKAAEKIEDDEKAARVARVLMLREAANNGAPKVEKLAVTSVPEKLSASRRILDSFEAGTH